MIPSPTYFDTHCHLDDPLLAGHLDTVLEEAAASGVERFIVPGVDPAGWGGIGELTRKIPRAAPAYGIHPMHAGQCDQGALDRLAELSGESVAIGEIGLDYLVAVSRELQKEAFRAQLRIAVAACLPVLIHCRRAFADLLAILKEEGVTRGVMHAFSGSPEVAAQCLRLGLSISISGTVTYPGARRPLEVARMVPCERLLLESDAPDLSPEPHRGKVNVPAYLLFTAERVAMLRGVSLPELACITSENAFRLFFPAERRL